MRLRFLLIAANPRFARERLVYGHVLQPAPVSLHESSAFWHDVIGQLWVQRPVLQPPGGQVVLHAHAVEQSTPPLQDMSAPHRTSHFDAAHSTVLQHELVAAQSTVHEGADPHDTAAHERLPEHSTVQGPVPHAT
jgi:hypothetical protein